MTNRTIKSHSFIQKESSLPFSNLKIVTLLCNGLGIQGYFPADGVVSLSLSLSISFQRFSYLFIRNGRTMYDIVLCQKYHISFDKTIKYKTIKCYGLCTVYKVSPKVCFVHSVFMWSNPCLHFSNHLLIRVLFSFRRCFFVSVRVFYYH